MSNATSCGTAFDDRATIAGQLEIHSAAIGGLEEIQEEIAKPLNEFN